MEGREEGIDGTYVPNLCDQWVGSEHELGTLHQKKKKTVRQKENENENEKKVFKCGKSAQTFL